MHPALPLHLLCSLRDLCSHAQKGISLRAVEVAMMVEAIMDGKLHKDYVYVGGQQCVRHQMVANAFSSTAHCSWEKNQESQFESLIFLRCNNHRHGVLLLWPRHVNSQPRRHCDHEDGETIGGGVLLRSYELCNGNSTRVTFRRSVAFSHWAHMRRTFPC